MLRRRQKEARLQSILDAAEALIRETGATEFSMLSLSTRADLSPATPYNLFGSKAGILYALLNRSLDAIFQTGALQPVEQGAICDVLRASDAASQVFTSDPAFYRPLYRFLLGVTDKFHRPTFMDRSEEFWMQATSGLSDRLDELGVEHEVYARQFVLHFVGALDFWVMNELTDRQFNAQTYFATIQHLLAVAQPHERAALLREIAMVKPDLPKRLDRYRVE